jgi:hypothetical protein
VHDVAKRKMRRHLEDKALEDIWKVLEGIAPWIAGKKKKKKNHLGSNTW